MFKSIFAKYLTTFIISILVSFTILSGIVASIISTHASEEKQASLYNSTDIVNSQVLRSGYENLRVYAETDPFRSIITSMMNMDRDVDILIVDEDNAVVLSTVLGRGSRLENGRKVLEKTVTLGQIDVEGIMQEKTWGDGGSYFYHVGKLGNYVESNSIFSAKKVEVKDKKIGFIISFASTEDINNLISATVRAVFISSAWVMLATVIAIYFVSERIISPLRNMTSASKKMASGDYSTRVTVIGNGEVSELGRAFNQMAESIENLDKMRSSFMASVSHDLRTPMTTISGFIEGITSGAIPPEKHEHYLGVISNEIHRLSRLVTQLLDVTRIESGDRKFNFEDFDIAEMARIILISFEQKIDEKRLDVNFECDDDIISAHADKDAIYQVLYNLCHNAIKFCDVGGKFKINITRAENKKIRVSVYDEGKIIEKDEERLVFERFFKSDKSRGLDKTGVGLGLYISKTIIDAHNEDIGVRTVNEKGTEFYFTIKEGGPIIRRKNTVE